MPIKKISQRKPDWWSKTLVGILLGLSLAFAISGIFAWVGPGGINAVNKAQFVMWMIAPAWMSFFSLTYFFRSGVQALGFFLLANAVAYSLLFSLNGFYTL